MKIGALTITSPIHDENLIKKNTQEYIEALRAQGNIDLEMYYDPKEMANYDFNVLYVATGGTEGIFKTFFDDLPEHIDILTSGAHNSLAASMEILTFLQQNGREGQILHGTTEYVANKLAKLCKFKRVKEELASSRLGIIGQPSDWLIASDVDKDDAKELLGITLVDIDINEVIERFNKIETVDEALVEQFNLGGFDKDEVIKALRVYAALKELVDEHNLQGLALRCFDLLGPLKTTGCLALALFNAQGIVASCEGDVPCMIAMRLLYLLTGETAFMCNPSRLDTQNNTGVFAHCTLPLDMCKMDHTLKTHFESNIGVALCGKIKEDAITMFKIGNTLDEYFVSDGTVLKNLEESNLCRTQIEITLTEDMCYFLKAPLSNHHLVCYGHHSHLIHDFMAFMS